MPDLGPSELIIILVIALLVFGGSRLADLGGSLGKGIREFKNAVKDPDDTTPAADAPAAAAPPVSVATPPAPNATAAGRVPPEPVEGPICPTCGTLNEATARFCNGCGAQMTDTNPAVTTPTPAP